jgi:putative acyl-CoA dehydrogenase
VDVAEANPHVARAGDVPDQRQAEAGHGCPMTMTFAAVPALRTTPELAETWIPRLTAASYDPSCAPARRRPSAAWR